MTESQDAILEKIRKLHEHAQSAQEIGSEEEAKAFAAKVQELLTAYKLSMSDVHRAATVDDEMGITYFTWEQCHLAPRRMRIPWSELLANLIGRTYYCKFIIAGYGGYIGSYVGTKTDREIAIYMFCFIAEFIEKLSYREYKRYYNDLRDSGGDMSEATNYRSGYITGFITRLGERFDEEVSTSSKDAAALSKVNAIVHVKKDALAKADQWMRENVKTKKCSLRMSGINHRGQGYADGKRAADDVNLNRPLTNGRPKGELR